MQMMGLCTVFVSRRKATPKHVIPELGEYASLGPEVQRKDSREIATF
jgi:hypothetical protein